MAQPIPVPPKFKKGDWIGYPWDTKGRYQYLVLRFRFGKYVLRHRGGAIEKPIYEFIDWKCKLLPTLMEQYAVDKVLNKYSNEV